MQTASSKYQTALEIADSPGSDLEGVFKLLKAADDDGDLRARYALATWFLNGVGPVMKDIKLGTRILRELSNSNIAEALYDLGVMYDHGWGCKPNATKAFECYMESALLGDTDACRQVAEYFRAGEIVPKSASLARAWKRRSRESEKDVSPPERVWLR